MLFRDDTVCKGRNGVSNSDADEGSLCRVLYGLSCNEETVTKI